MGSGRFMPQTPSEQADSLGRKMQLPCSILNAHSLGGNYGDHGKQEKSEEEPRVDTDMGHDNTAIG